MAAGFALVVYSFGEYFDGVEYANSHFHMLAYPAIMGSVNARDVLAVLYLDDFFNIS